MWTSRGTILCLLSRNKVASSQCVWDLSRTAIVWWIGSDGEVESQLVCFFFVMNSGGTKGAAKDGPQAGIFSITWFFFGGKMAKIICFGPHLWWIRHWWSFRLVTDCMCYVTQCLAIVNISSKHISFIVSWVLYFCTATIARVMSPSPAWGIIRREWVARTRMRRTQSLTIGHAIFNNLQKVCAKSLTICLYLQQ